MEQVLSCAHIAWVGLQLTLQHWLLMSKPCYVIEVFPDKPFKEAIIS